MQAFISEWTRESAINIKNIYWAIACETFSDAYKVGCLSITNCNRLIELSAEALKKEKGYSTSKTLQKLTTSSEYSTSVVSLLPQRPFSSSAIVIIPSYQLSHSILFLS